MRKSSDLSNKRIETLEMVPITLTRLMKSNSKSKLNQSGEIGGVNEFVISWNTFDLKNYIIREV